jgi:hypothetical protein
LPDRVEPALDRGPQAVLGFFRFLAEAGQSVGCAFQPFLLDLTCLSERIRNPAPEPVKVAAEFVPENLGGIGLLADAVVELLLNSAPPQPEKQ